MQIREKQSSLIQILNSEGCIFGITTLIINGVPKLYLRGQITDGKTQLYAQFNNIQLDYYLAGDITLKTLFANQPVHYTRTALGNRKYTFDFISDEEENYDLQDQYLHSLETGDYKFHENASGMRQPVDKILQGIMKATLLRIKEQKTRILKSNKS